MKKAEILSSLNAIQKADGQPYFHIEYLIDNVLSLTPEEKEENKKYWLKDSAGAGSGPEGAPGEEGGAEGMGDMGTEGGGETETTEAPETPAPEEGGESGGGTEFEF
jgi:hypothetical protein